MRTSQQFNEAGNITQPSPGDRGKATDYVQVSWALLTSYPAVSDGAKLTFITVCGHDWYDRKRGGRKGYVFPTIGRLAKLRATTARSVQRHLAELISAGLLTRIPRRGKANVFSIGSPKNGEVKALVPTSGPGGDKTDRRGMTLLSPQEEDKQKLAKTVNGDRKEVMEERRATSKGFCPIGALLKSNPVGQVRSSKRHWLAEQMVSATGDEASLGCYLRIARDCPPDLIFDAIACLKEAKQLGTVRKSRGALLVGIIRRLCRERHLSDPLRNPTNSNSVSQRAPVIATGADQHRIDPLVALATRRLRAPAL